MVILFDIIFIRLFEDEAISPFLQRTNNTPIISLTFSP